MEGCKTISLESIAELTSCIQLVFHRISRRPFPVKGVRSPALIFGALLLELPLYPSSVLKVVQK